MTSPTLPPEAEALVRETIQRLRDGYFVTAEYGRRDWWTDSVPVVLRDLARRLLEPGEKERDMTRLIESLYKTTAADAGVVWRDDGPNGTQRCHNLRAEAVEQSLSSLRAELDEAKRRDGKA